MIIKIKKTSQILGVSWAFFNDKDEEFGSCPRKIGGNGGHTFSEACDMAIKDAKKLFGENDYKTEFAGSCI